MSFYHMRYVKREIMRQGEIKKERKMRERKERKRQRDKETQKKRYKERVFIDLVKAGGGRNFLLQSLKPNYSDYMLFSIRFGSGAF